MIKKRIQKNCLLTVFTVSKTSGFTVLEVILAVVILTITTTAIMHFILVGDRVYGRSLLIENATQLARNEAELLKAQAPVSETIEDCEYEKLIGDRSFIVIRQVMENDSLDSLGTDYPIRGIELHVKEEISSDEPLVTFKLIQGYNVK